MPSGPPATPLLEFDDSSPAFIEPSEHAPAIDDVPEACVVTFFGDAVRRLREHGRARLLTDNAWEDGPHPLLEMEHDGQRVALMHSGVDVDADPVAVGVVTRLLRERRVAFQTGRVWTTDAPYRQTPAKIEARRAEGCIAVEMEAAALAAVAQFRGVPLAHLLYGGDDLSSAAWDNRSWQTQADVRDNLLSLAASAASNSALLAQDASRKPVKRPS